MPPTSSPAGKPTVFVSYAHEDLGRVTAIVHGLENAGYDVWWDDRLQPGSAYPKEIEARVTAADIVLVVWSADARESDWVRDEAERGRKRRVLVQGTLDDPAPPIGFGQTQSLDLTAWDGDYQAAEWAKLIEGVEGRRAASALSKKRRARLLLAAHVLGVTVSWTVLFSGALWGVYGGSSLGRWLLDTTKLLAAVLPVVVWAAVEARRASFNTWQYLVRRSAHLFFQGAMVTMVVLLLAAVTGIATGKPPRAALRELLGVFLIGTVIAACLIALVRLGLLALRYVTGRMHPRPG